jgi:hypothetical protein
VVVGDDDGEIPLIAILFIGGWGLRREVRRRGLVLFVALTLLIPSIGAAQVLQSFEDLPLRVNLNDQVQIQDESGAKVRGRVTRLTRDEIMIETSAGEKRFTRDTVHAAARRGYALRGGAVIGAGAFAVLGGIATCSHEGGSACGIVGPVRAAPIGAGLGLALGGLTPQMKPVYRGPEGAVSVSRSPRAGSAESSLLEELGAWVNLDDRLRIEEPSGMTRTGRLTGLTDTELRIETSSGERRLTREALRRVAVRHRPLRAAALIGAGAGAAYGGLAACLTGDRTECPDATLIGAGLGAGAGFVAGMLLQSTKVVYPEPDRQQQGTIRVAPFVPPGGGFAVIGSWSWSRNWRRASRHHQ